jgi:hypothetical protein
MSEHVAEVVHPAPGRPLRDGLLVFGVLGGPVAWAAQLVVQYAATPALCGSGRTPLLHLVTAAALVVTGAALVAARRAGRTVGEAAEEVTVRRVHAMRLAGTVTSGFFLLVVLAQGLPALLLDPCLR